MPINQETLNAELFKLLKSNGYEPNMLDSSGELAGVPDEAEVFQFKFRKDGEDYGKVTISIDGLHKLVIYFSDDIASSEKEESHGEDESWYKVLNQLKRFSQKYQLSLDELKALKINEDLRDTLEMATSLMNIGTIYTNMGDYKMALEKYFEAVKKNEPDLTKYSTPQGANWQNVNDAKGGWASLVLVIDKEKIPRVEVYLRRRDDGGNLELYKYLKEQREQIEKEFGHELVWDEQEHLVSRRIMSRRDKAVDLAATNTHNELIDWFLQEHKKFKKYIFPRVYEFTKQSD